MPQKNNNIVTLVKAVGIFLMVFGHVVSSSTITSKVIFAFHMPLFFVMSGYCFKEKYLNDAKQFVVRKFKGIWLPFILFSLPYLAMHNVLCKWNIYDPDCLYGWKTFAWVTGRIVTRMSHNEGLLGTFWFLKELFWGNIIFYFAYKLSKGRLLPTVIGLFVLTEVMCIFHLQIPYFTIGQRSFYAAFFISIGYLWKKYEWQVNRWWIWVIAIIGLVTELYLTDGMSMQNLSPLNLTLYAIPAILVTMVVFGACQIVDPYLQGKIKDLAIFVGNHTLSIMALHFTAFKVVSLIYIKIFDLPMSRLVDFPVMDDLAKTWWGGIGYILGGMVLPLCCAWLWIKMKEKILFLLQNEEK